MDNDLVLEIERLNRVLSEKGEFAFLCECQDAWLRTLTGWRPSPLFAICSPDGKEKYLRDGIPVGCPFSIRFTQGEGSRPLVAWTDAWTAAILADTRISWFESRMRSESLWAIAEWQQTFRDYFAERRLSQLQSRPRRLRAMLRHHARS